MTTSLARQLEQLRAVSVDTQNGSQGPSILSTTLTGEQLTLLAKEAFQALCSTAPCIVQFKSIIFASDQDNLDNESDDEMECGEESHTLEDLLFILSEHVLSKPAQYLLQYLITKLNIHIKHPETLLFITLPYYQFEIFNKIVGCLPVKKTTSEHEDHPRWVEHFRSACHPATSVGLHRHLACDKGFFNLVCSHMSRLIKVHFAKFDVQNGVSYNNMIHCFATIMVSSLNLCNSVSDSQTIELMRIGFAGLKSHKSRAEVEDSTREEFYSLSMLILTYLLTRVQLKPKLCSRLLKILGREVSMETLALLMILYRSQRQNMKDEKLSIAKLFLKHSEIASDLMDNADQKGEEEKEYAKKMQKSVGLLLYDVCDIASYPDLVELLRFNYKAMVKSLLTSELAEILAKAISKILERLQEKKNTGEKNGNLTSGDGILLCNRISNILKTSYSEEYVKNTKISHKSDIYIMENEDEVPSQNEVTVKRILYDNELLKSLMKDPDALLFSWKESFIVSGKVRKRNSEAVTSLFSLVSPAFLLRHIPPADLICLVTRLLMFYESKTEIVLKIIDFLASEEFQTCPKIKEQLETQYLDLSILILPLTFSKDESIRGKALQFVQKLTKMELSGKEDPEYLFERYIKNFDVVYLNALADIFLKCQTMQVAHLFAFIALGAETCFDKEDYGENVEETLRKILSVIALAVDNLNLTRIPTSSDLSKYELYLSTEGKIHVSTVFVERLLESIKHMPKLILDSEAEITLCILTLEIGCALQNLSFKEASQTAFKLYSPDEFPHLFLKICSLEHFDCNLAPKLHKEYFNEAQIHSAKKISKALNGDILYYRIPFVVATLMSTLNPVRKRLMKALMGITLEGKSQMFSSFIDHLRKNVVEIKSSHLNMPDIIQEYVAHSEAHDQLGKLLSVTIDSGNSGIITRICPLLKSIDNLASLKKAILFGNQFLLNPPETLEKKNCLHAIVVSFIPACLIHFDDSSCFNFVSGCLSAHSILVLHKNLENTIPLLTLKCIYKQLKNNTSDKNLAKKLFGVMIDLSANCESSEVLKMVINIINTLPQLRTKQILKKLEKIWGERLVKDVKSLSGGRFSVRSSTDSDVGKKWRLTLFLLEVALPRIGDKSFPKLHSLLKPLGMLIKEALDQADQFDNSYHIDLLLSSILDLMNKIGPDNLTEKSINPELMVRCIRTCQNPNTKATALLILAKLSAANPEYILHNSIPIFTFMGTHFLKIDAKHSFDVACQAIDVIIPHIQSVCMAKNSSKGTSKLADTSLTILHTFADASLDMPHRHRVHTFMHKLIVRLGEKDYLWILALLLIKQFDNSKHRKFAPQTTQDKLERLRELFSKFNIKIQIDSVLKLILNLRDNSETLKIVFGKNHHRVKEMNPELEKAIGTLNVHTMAVINHLLTSEVFITQVLKWIREVEESHDEKLFLYKQLEEILVASIVNIDFFEELVKLGSVRKQMVPCCEKILESVLSLLPMKAFVQLLSSLMINQKNSVRRKMLEVFNAKLQQQQDGFLEESVLPGLIGPLLDLATDPEIEPNPVNQQMALLCLRSFGKLASASFPSCFVPVCKKLVDENYLRNIENQAVKAATLLCLTELFQTMGPHSVSLLNPFVTWLLKLIDDPVLIQENIVVLNSLILSVQKCLDNFGGFLNPFFKQFIVSSCRLMKVNHERENSQDDDRKSQALKIRLKNLCFAVSRSIPSQKLIDLGAECYEELLCEPQDCLVAFSVILKENLSQMNKAQALAFSVPCLKLFQILFKYRQREKNLSKVDKVESHFIETFLTLMLKLSLDDFKPIFYRLFNLSVGGGGHSEIDSLTTMFHITNSVAKKLKSLFSFICETLVQKTTNIFEQYSKDDFSLLRSLSKKSSKKLANLFHHVFDTLTEVFTHNQVESILAKNYEDHVNAILSHIEAPLDPDDIQLLHSKILECLGQLASSTEDETQWKYLNYQVLLFIRNNSLQVRLFVLEVLDLFVEKKGENYLTVLPDSVPLLAEALEDDDSRVEEKCRSLIKKMETVFGHSVESYFE